MDEKTVLEKIRRYTLWAVLGSSALLLLISILKTWGIVHSTPTIADMMIDPYSSLGGYGFDGPSAVGRFESTLGVILSISFLTLVTVFVSSWVKKADADVAASKK